MDMGIITDLDINDYSVSGDCHSCDFRKVRKMENYIDMFLRLIKENPGLPIVPVVDGDVVGDDSYQWWIAEWGRSEVDEYYIGREKFHLRSDADEEDVLNDLDSCSYGYDYYGRDIYELSDEEWNKLYAGVQWIKAIIVHITA